jgi:predicted RND superfamily exporter protein
LWTIFDSNITTVIGAVVLYFLGTGPIKGFSITLMLGVAVSMFCSLVITRSFAKLYLIINPANARRLRLTSNNPYVHETPVANATPVRRKRSLNLGETK